MPGFAYWKLNYKIKSEIKTLPIIFNYPNTTIS